MLVVHSTPSSSCPSAIVHPDRTVTYTDLEAVRAYAQNFRVQKPYRTMQELAFKEREGVDFTRTFVDRNSSVVIVAPHGGNLEPGTSEIAERLADANLSVYCFNSLKPQTDESLHITSRLFDCLYCEQLVTKSEHVLTVHGCRGDFEAVFVGGKNRELGYELSRRFREEALIPSVPDPVYFGRDPKNICNRGSSGFGIQLEITTALRDRLVGEDAEIQRRFDSTVKQFIMELSSGSLR